MAKIERRKCPQCGVNRQAKFWTSEKGRVCTVCQKKKRKASSKNSHLKAMYGISNEDYQAMWDAQGGRCAICRGLRTVFDVDHDHATGLVRGLACRRCNRWLLPGCVDDIRILEDAIQYLKEPPAVAAIGEIYIPTTEEEDDR